MRWTAAITISAALPQTRHLARIPQDCMPNHVSLRQMDEWAAGAQGGGPGAGAGA